MSAMWMPKKIHVTIGYSVGEGDGMAEDNYEFDWEPTEGQPIKDLFDFVSHFDDQHTAMEAIVEERNRQQKKDKKK